MRYWISAVLLTLGIVGVAFGYPPRATPTAVDVSFPGSYTAPGGFEVTEPGPYTVWAAGTRRYKGNRCEISRPDGSPIRVTGPRLPVRWETGGDAVDTYVAIGSFELPAAGAYGIRCTLDPATPGMSFAVTAKPNVVPSLVAAVGGAVCVLAAVVVAVVGWRRRRAAPRNGGPG